MSFKTKLALCFTFIYIYGLSLVVLIRLGEFLSMPLNELGDFLAGAFGPLALAWLVFGYFQQGDELKQGTEALLMQAEELRHSVEQQTAMADSQKASLDNHERELEPLLKLTHEGSKEIEGDYYDSFWIKNLGAYCECVEVFRLVEGERVKCFSLQPLFNGDSLGFLLDLNEEDAVFLIGYKRINGSLGQQAFTVKHYWDHGPEITVYKQPFVL